MTAVKVPRRANEINTCGWLTFGLISVATQAERLLDTAVKVGAKSDNQVVIQSISDELSQGKTK